MNKRIRYGLLTNESYKDIRIHATAELHTQIAGLVSSNVGKGARILDAGAGEGALSQRLTDMGFRIVSLDQNQSAFKAGNELHALDFNNKELLDEFISTNKNSFDAAVCIEVMEHLQNPWQQIGFLKSVLNSNGFLILSTPNTGSWLSRFLFFITGRLYHFRDDDLNNSGHITPLFDWQLEMILKQAGFRNIQFQKSLKLPLYVASKSLLFNIAFLKAPFYRLFMKGRSRYDVMLITATC